MFADEKIKEKIRSLKNKGKDYPTFSRNKLLVAWRFSDATHPYLTVKDQNQFFKKFVIEVLVALFGKVFPPFAVPSFQAKIPVRSLWPCFKSFFCLSLHLEELKTCQKLSLTLLSFWSIYTSAKFC